MTFDGILKIGVRVRFDGKEGVVRRILMDLTKEIKATPFNVIPTSRITLKIREFDKHLLTTKRLDEVEFI